MSLTTDDLKVWTADEARMRAHALAGFRPFDVWCGTCLFVLAEPGPGCCKYVEPLRSFWRRLLGGNRP